MPNRQPKVTTMSRAQFLVMMIHVHFTNLLHAIRSSLEGAHVLCYSSASMVIEVRCRKVFDSITTRLSVQDCLVYYDVYELLFHIVGVASMAS